MKSHALGTVLLLLAGALGCRQGEAKPPAPPPPVMELGRLSIARRPAIDLAPAVIAPAAMADGSPAMDTADLDLESLSAFDVPAFLRREG